MMAAGVAAVAVARHNREQRRRVGAAPHPIDQLLVGAVAQLSEQVLFNVAGISVEQAPDAVARWCRRRALGAQPGQVVAVQGRVGAVAKGLAESRLGVLVAVQLAQQAASVAPAGQRMGGVPAC